MNNFKKNLLTIITCPMRKIVFISLMAIFCFAITLSTFANSTRYIGNDEIAIGGITLTSTEEYVQSIYGAPDNVEYNDNAVWGNTHTVVLAYK